MCPGVCGDHGDLAVGWGEWDPGPDPTVSTRSLEPSTDPGRGGRGRK